MRRIVLVLAGTLALLLQAVGPVVAAAPNTGGFSVLDDFEDAGSCPFTIHIVIQIEGRFQVFFDAAGNVTRVFVHEHWLGTDTNESNGKVLVERGSTETTYDFAAGTQTTTGQIHLVIPFGGQGGHDRGNIVYSLADGTILIDHGHHPGAEGTGAGCAAFL